MRDRGLLVTRELLPVLAVSLAVSVLFTFASAVFDQIHQVSAEDQRTYEVGSAINNSQTQSLAIKEWGITLQAPYGSDMPQIKYASQGLDSVGLTSAVVEKYGSECMASNNAIGAIVRVEAGQIKNPASQGVMSLGTVGRYTYMYETPETPCAATGAEAFANQEEMNIEGDAVLASE